jgi:sigma-B regulation protein RsbU (phosphoserine phosphatase)
MSAVPAERGIAQLPLFRRNDRLKPLHTLPDVHAVSLPARAFTGDFYFTHRHGDRLWFALGDVAGKGINAAVFMAMIQEELEHRIQSCAASRCDPAVTTQRLDAFLRPLLPPNRFATAIIGNLSDDGTVVIANAGHCPPLIVRRDGTLQSIASTGPVVGMLRSSRWTSVSARVERGETLLLYSDGLVEASSPDGLEFGASGIERSQRRGSAREIAEEILAAVDRHARGVRADDLTLVVVRR